MDGGLSEDGKRRKGTKVEEEKGIALINIFHKLTIQKANMPKEWKERIIITDCFMFKSSRVQMFNSSVNP